MEKRKIIAAIVIVSLIAASVTIGVLLSSGKSSKEVSFQDVSRLVDIELAKTIVHNLSSMGTMTGINGENLGFRNAGSSAAIQASLFVRDEMNHIGLSNVTLDEIPLDSWELKSAWVNVPGIGKLQAISHGGSGNTSSSPYASPNGSITAEIIDVGNGAESDYIGKNVTGRIVLSNFDKNLWTNTHAFEAQLHGAIAVVFATYENPSTFGPDLGYGANKSAMVAMDGMYKLSYPPVLVISGADGETLIYHIKNSAGPVTVTIFSDIKIKTEQEGAFGYNVVGYLPSKNYGKPDDQFMIVGDHTDAWFYGASDNDAGVATVLVIADAFKKAYDLAGTSPNRTMIFITHDAEEWGRFGTYYDWSWGAYYEITHMHPEWVGRTVGAIIPDGVGYDYAFGLECSPELDTFVKSVVDANRQRLPYGTDYYDLGTSADHWSYAAAGIPSIGCYNWGDFQYQYYHTQLDVEKNINYTYLNGMIVTIADMTFRLTNAQILPYNFSLVADKLRTAMVDSLLDKASQLLPIYQKYRVDSDANLSRAVTAAEDFAEKADRLAWYLPSAVSQTPTEAELNKVNSLLLGMSKILGQSLLSIGVWDNIGYPYTQSLYDVRYLDDSISILSGGLPTLSQVSVAIQTMKGVGITPYYDSISEPNYRELYNVSYREGMISFGTQEHLAPAVDVWDEVDRLTQMMDNWTVNATELADIITHLQQKMTSQAFVNLENGFHAMWTALEQTNGMLETFIYPS